MGAANIEPHSALLVPFIAMLLCIALLPIILQHHWERSYHLIALFLSTIPITYYVLVLGQPARLLHEAHDYFSFIALIGSLFVVTGGIHIGLHGRFNALRNSFFLLAGGCLANIIGTTGASALLIRPWIRLNRKRYAGLHTAFFIFIIGNVGGGLTPLGPPLLFGYLKGVPFWWTAVHCWRPWLIAMFSLLVIFYVLDTIAHRKSELHSRHPERKPRDPELQPLGRLPRDPSTALRSAQDDSVISATRFKGRRNLWFLGIILAAVFVDDPPFVREILMILAAAASYYFTPRSLRELNSFSFAPLREVAWLFFGIFATMIPVIDFMRLHANQFPIATPSQNFWITGALSSVLDNAPTYLTFLSTALGRENLSVENPADIAHYLGQHPLVLSAISMGAVIFGALTYIGNGPNFLVKSTVQQARLPAPSFFGFLKYSLPVFAPVLGLVWFFTFR
jgi:Na+/H+ antiporter NhaD/arsenite permease-like protein